MVKLLEAEDPCNAIVTLSYSLTKLHLGGLLRKENYDALLSCLRRIERVMCNDQEEAEKWLQRAKEVLGDY